MKISKLFHWLYAILMLLPVVVFIPTAFYYGFNEHAVAQEKTEQVPVYYESNVVNSIDDLYVGNIYYYSNNMHDLAINSNTLIYINTDLLEEELNLTDLLEANLYFTNNAVGLQYSIVGSTINRNINLVPMNFIIESFVNKTNIPSEFLQKVNKTNFKYVKDYQPLTTNMSITDSMSYAWDSVWQNDLFSWSYDSFLTQPFLYITNLFNVPPTNTLLYCLSYWLNISIIWLVFDIVLYVPLLVHRWIDKGIVE